MEVSGSRHRPSGPESIELERKRQLLDLDPIPLWLRQFLIELGPDPGAVLAGLGAREGDHLEDRIVDIEALPAQRSLLDDIPDPPDDVRGPVATARVAFASSSAGRRAG